MSINDSSAHSLKRTKIRPPKKTLSGSEVDFNKSWEVLSFAIKQIQSKNSSSLSFEELYRISYNLVLRKFGKSLYNNVLESIKTHLLCDIRSKILSTTEDDKKFLLEVNKQWQENLLSTRMISDVLMYLNRVYSKQNHLLLIYDVGLELFRDYIIKYNNNEIGDRIIRIVINEVNKNRDTGEIIDKFLIKSIIYMLETLPGEKDDGENYYVKYFEPVFLDASLEFYNKISNEIIAFQNGLVYINKIDQLIKDEEQRNILYLPQTTFPKLVDLMNNVLIDKNLNIILRFENEGLKNLVDNIKLPQLNLIYKLVLRCDTELSILKILFHEIILNEGDDLMKKTKELVSPINNLTNSNKQSKSTGKENTTQFAVKWVENILELMDKYEEILKKSFAYNQQLAKAINSSISQLLNTSNNVCEYLSLFIDDCIKRAFKNRTEEECEAILDKSIVIFRHIKDKDLFEKYYKKHLAKRLLQQKSISNELERSMISKIKQELGASFTSKLEGMFRDIKISKDLSSEFKTLQLKEAAEVAPNNQKELSKKKLEVDVNILTTTFWPLPLTKDNNFKFPESLHTLKEKYENFYLSKHNARILIWAPNFGTVDIRMRFKKKLYEINMPTYSGAIIMLFDNQTSDKKYTFDEIYELTNIPKQELKRQLQSISVAPRTRLLIKKPMSRDVKHDDVFKINENFHSNLTKVKVSAVSLSNKPEDDSERGKTIESVDRSRKYETDAAIVRIMKARKTATHNELMNETIRQLQNRFKPPPSLIKQRIEALLEREYLARSSDDRNVYNYLA
ncbi:hypothetical protein PACTADRAFT_70591 [Pachysolen tannophilus NRRL Y-2460]|uniref:Cullin family profile domain-containing protein n=1 Tax=Pachysolen tannophilus NRRL Y-2460 TaxID=669874 RepID=A0A1E4TQS9_PACTA|nr:hypothetical protein PACTADRAFT_70591 [Pachysolen tannophilus NRRL Y-2460]